MAFASAVLAVLTSAPALAQDGVPPGITRVVDMAGPRFGLTILSQAAVDELAAHRGITVRPLISQFGWQFEKRFYTNGDGVTVLTEWVPLLSGLEQGLAMPSLNWLVGVRGRSGAEFGIGPNVTPIGVGLVVAGGVTVRSGALHVPLTFAVATSKTGARVTILTGFNLRRR